MFEYGRNARRRKWRATTTTTKSGDEYNNNDGGNSRTRAQPPDDVYDGTKRWPWSAWRNSRFLSLSAALLSVGIWYGTPVSSFLTEYVVLPMVPVQADIELGIRAMEEFPYAASYRSRWTSEIRSVGTELVQSYRRAKQQRRGRNDKKKYKRSGKRYYDSSFSAFYYYDQDDDQDDAYRWDFAVIRADSAVINAFALPGGTVRVTEALLEALQLTRGEIAALLGHGTLYFLCYTPSLYSTRRR